MAALLGRRRGCRLRSDDEVVAKAITQGLTLRAHWYTMGKQSCSFPLRVLRSFPFRVLCWFPLTADVCRYTNMIKQPGDG